MSNEIEHNKGKPFVLLDFPIDSGFRVIEAGAGSGKTHNLVRLVLRMIVGHGSHKPVLAKRILMVTFTEAAALEMRQRVRDLLESASMPQLQEEDDNDVYEIMGAKDADLFARRRGLVISALNQLGMMQISTIHGFCMRAYSDHAVNAGFPPLSGPPQDGGELMEQIASDWIRLNAKSALKLVELTKVVSVLAAEPTAKLFDVDNGLIEYVRKRAADPSVTTFDTLITRLLYALPPSQSANDQERSCRPQADDTKCDALAKAIRADYDVCMVDESQDTDRRQWQIFSVLFGPEAKSDKHRLILVGDPKQSIYGFRGADVNSYCEARNQAGDGLFKLTANWRSSPAMIDRFNGFFERPGFFQTQGIVYSTASHEGKVINCGNEPPVKVLHSDDPKVIAKLARDMIYEFDLENIGRDGKQLPLRDGKIDSSLPPEKRADVAILTRTNSRADLLYRELISLGLEASLESQQSVFTTTTAFQVQLLLRAVLRPSDGGRVRSLMLSRPALFGEHTELDPRKMSVLAEWLQSCERVWRGKKGFSAAWDKLTREAPYAKNSEIKFDSLTQSLARCHFRHRALTDLAHLGELLISRNSRNQWEPEQLLRHLSTKVMEQDDEADAGGDDDDEQMANATAEEQLRPESSLARILVRTIHKSKGLEYNGVIIDNVFEKIRSRKAGTLVRSERGLFIYTSLNKDNIVEDDVLKELCKAFKAAKAECELAEKRKKSTLGFKKVATQEFNQADAARKAAKKDKKPESEIEILKQEADRLEAEKDRLASAYESFSPQLEEAKQKMSDAEKLFKKAESAALNPADEIKKQMRQEDARLLYVAMTRARQKLVIAGKLLESTNNKAVNFDGFSFIFKSVGLDGCLNSEAKLVEKTSVPLYGHLELEAVGVEQAEPTSEDAKLELNIVELYPGAADLEQGAFERRFSVGSTSYSNLTKYGATLKVDMSDGGAPGTDESHSQINGSKNDEVEFLIPQELQGAEFGNALHKLMECLPDFKGKEFTSLLDRHLGYHISKVKDPLRQVAVRQRLLDSIPLWLETKLGRHDPSIGCPFALETISKAKCLAEVRFTFAASINAKARDDIDAAFAEEFSKYDNTNPKQILKNLRLGPASTPPPGEKTSLLAEKRHRLSYPIDGLLNGSIDLFFQEQQSGRYFILDWKTNRLGVSLEDYGDESMAEAMLEAKYHLQLAIYSMVADEYMRSRLGRSWDFETNFGGAYYLFLRAFGVNPNSPDLGVFYHLPSKHFINKLREAVGRPSLDTNSKNE